MRFYLAVMLCAGLLVAGACGGGSGSQDEDETEEGGEANLSITTISFPNFVTGDEVDIVFDLRGGCGGPYTATLLSGALPDGLVLDDAVVNNGDGTMKFRHHMKGILCRQGTFDFTVSARTLAEFTVQIDEAMFARAKSVDARQKSPRKLRANVARMR